MKLVCTQPNRATAYHTSEACPRIRGETDEIHQSAIEFHALELCEWCGDNVDLSGERGPQPHKEFVGGV